jgi:hypothetical protein
MLVAGPIDPHRPLSMFRPPRVDAPSLLLDRTVRLDVEYDETFLEQHGDGVEAFLREAIAIAAIEWRRYRREWLEPGEMRLRAAGEERDATHVLSAFLHRTDARKDTIHACVVGRVLEVYTNGTHAVAIAGLAFRGSDVVVVSATPGVGSDLLAYYLFHEIGHLWDAYDIPFRGGDSTYGSKTRVTYTIDAGNEEIIEDAPGPLPRDTPRRAPAVIREKLARARATAGRLPVYASLHDLLLHEPSPVNPAYVRKKAAVLEAAGPARASVEALVRRYESTRQDRIEDAEVRQQIAEHYWHLHDAIAARDYDTAQKELEAVTALANASPDVHMLLGAVERKIRRQR